MKSPMKSQPVPPHPRAARSVSPRRLSHPVSGSAQGQGHRCARPIRGSIPPRGRTNPVEIPFLKRLKEALKSHGNLLILSLLVHFFGGDIRISSFFPETYNCHDNCYWIELGENLQGSEGFSRNQIRFFLAPDSIYCTYSRMRVQWFRNNYG